MLTYLTYALATLIIINGVSVLLLANIAGTEPWKTYASLAVHLALLILTFAYPMTMVALAITWFTITVAMTTYGILRMYGYLEMLRRL